MMQLLVIVLNKLECLDKLLTALEEDCLLYTSDAADE